MPLPGKTFSAFAIGFLVGIAIFAAATKGLSFWTFFPLMLAGIMFGVRKTSTSKSE